MADVPQSDSMTRRRLLERSAAVGVAVALPGLIAAPASTASRTARAQKGTVRIGASLPLTAWGAAEGALEKNGIQLAVNQLNAQGGIAGRKVELVVLDVGDMAPDKMVTTFNTLIYREKVDVIAGGWYLYTGAEYKVVAKGEIPYLHVNTQEANAITERDDPSKYWMCFQCDPTEIWYGLGFPPFLQGLIRKGLFRPRNRKIAIIAASDPYATRIANTLRTAMRKVGWQVSLFEKVVAPVSEWGPVLGKIRQDPPDVIFNTDLAVPDIAAFAKQFATDPTRSLVYGQYGPSQPQYKELAGEAANGVIWSAMTSLLPSARGKTYVRRYRSKYKSDPGLSAAGFSYDMIMLYAKGLEASGGDPKNTKAVARAIRNASYRGINGLYRFHPRLRTPTPYPDFTKDLRNGFPHCYFQIQNGKDEFIAPAPYVTSKFKLPPWFA
jgi:branched-chain amino acid transport system substrate-binding protein